MWTRPADVSVPPDEEMGHSPHFHSPALCFKPRVCYKEHEVLLGGPVPGTPLSSSAISTIPSMSQNTGAGMFPANGDTLDFSGAGGPLSCHCVDSCSDSGSSW